MNRPGYLSTPTSASLIATTNGIATRPQVISQQDYHGPQTLAVSPASTPSTAFHSPLGWTAPSRQTSRPCRCGRGRCRWLFSYANKIIIAVHEFLPSNQSEEPHTTTLKPLRKINVDQKATFMASQNGLEVSFLKTFSSPLFRYCKDNAWKMRKFLKGEPWIDTNRIAKDKVVCLGCGCDVYLGSGRYDPGNWMYHRDECVGIEDAILNSVLNAWEVKSAKSLAANS